MIMNFVRGAFLMLALAMSAQAVSLPIIGSVETAGRFRTNTGDLGNATQIDFSNGGAWTIGGTGDYAAAGAASLEVTYQSFTFNPSLTAPVNPLWRFTDGALDYSFVMNSVDIRSQTATALQLIGFGTLYITGFDPTPGIWEFSSFLHCTGPDCSGRFKFISEAGSVPEPGTLALLGLGLLGVGFAGRRRKA